jgi:uncharacterized C2H2 Zn-finger protein
MSKPTNVVKCSQCGKGFPSVLKLTLHVRKAHGGK